MVVAIQLFPVSGLELRRSLAALFRVKALARAEIRLIGQVPLAKRTPYFETTPVDGGNLNPHTAK